jgi:SAM-dependent methyltransferase
MYYLFLTTLLLLFVMVGIRYYYPAKALDENHSNFEKTQKILTQLFHNINTTAISLQERHNLGLDQDAYIYGEIDFYSFYKLLERIKPEPHEIFFDLGSGSGKAVFTAALHFDLAKTYGVEYLPALSTLSINQQAELQLYLETKQDEWHRKLLARTSAIHFINANFLNIDISQADIIFIAATCFSYFTWQTLCEQLLNLKPGSRVIVATKKIKHAQFALISEEYELMSWGMNAIHIYKKIS